MSAARPPAISVLLPARNARRWIRHSVGDLLAQRDVDLEVVAVDDGSTDRTRVWLEERARSDARLRVASSGGAGVAAALNVALAATRAPLVGHMEADDRCPPDRFVRLAARLAERDELDGVVSRVGLTGFRTPGMRRYVDWQNRLLDGEAMARARFLEIPAMQQTGLYRRCFLEGLGGFRDDPRWPFDIDFWMRAFAAGARVEKLPRVLYRWRQHEAQSTRTSPRHGAEALLACKVHFLLAGPARGRPLVLLSRGRTLERWREALVRAGAGSVEARDWRPGSDAPPSAPERGLRLFAYGSPTVRERIEQQLGGLGEHDWFVA